MFIKDIPPQGLLTGTECFRDQIAPKLWDVLCVSGFVTVTLLIICKDEKKMLLWHFQIMQLQAFEVKPSEAYFASFWDTESRFFLN